MEDRLDLMERGQRLTDRILQEADTVPSILLMCRNDPVLRFHQTRGELEILNSRLMPYSLRGQVANVVNSSSLDGLSPASAARIVLHNNEVFKSFIARRVLSLTRSNAKTLLNVFNFSQSDDVDTRFKIALACHGVSMSDSYWLKIEGSFESWDEMNIKKVPLSKIVASIALNGRPLAILGDPPLQTPEFLTKGIYAKAWQRESDGFCYLKKRGLFGRDLDPKCEVEASSIMDHFDVSHARYTLIEDEYGCMSKCRCVATENLGLVDASELKARFDRYNHEEGDTFTNYVLERDRENVLKMCVMDFLCSNADRHIDNWGFYQDYSKGELTTLYPLIDLNRCFDPEVIESKDGGPCLSLADLNLSQRDIAIMAMRELDMRMKSPIDRKDFFFPEHYESFLEKWEIISSRCHDKSYGVPGTKGIYQDKTGTTFESRDYEKNRMRDADAYDI